MLPIQAPFGTMHSPFLLFTQRFSQAGKHTVLGIGQIVGCIRATEGADQVAGQGVVLQLADQRPGAGVIIFLGAG